jgi:predicted RND superfamily exporter protein
MAYENPGFSLPVGGALTGLGLIYNMSKVNFISVLGDQFVREAVIFAFIFVFTILPIVFHKHKAAIAIDLGIIASMLLFNGQAYFLAIPLIFASIVLFKKLSALTAVYYGLISTPLLMMQYSLH